MPGSSLQVSQQLLVGLEDRRDTVCELGHGDKNLVCVTPSHKIRQATGVQMLVLAEVMQSHIRWVFDLNTPEACVDNNISCRPPPPPALMSLSASLHTQRNATHTRNTHTHTHTHTQTHLLAPTHCVWQIPTSTFPACQQHHRLQRPQQPDTTAEHAHTHMVGHHELSNKSRVDPQIILNFFE